MDYIVKTKNGILQGCLDGQAAAWMGIPYAKPPLGRLRFAPPQPADNWEGVRDAIRFASAAIQDTPGIREVSEDCLYLNIWSPAVDGKKRPVLFFIHGGSCQSGSGNEDLYYGKYLAHDQDLVIVTVDYRLGVLGFLDFSFLGDSFCANCGLHDVVLALKWVHENIAAFGGDPQNITVIGQSAGGTIAATLATVPLARPYISKCIVMSGGPTHLQTRQEAQETAKKYLEFMGIEDAEELYSIPAEKIAACQKNFNRYCKTGSGTFRLAVDRTLVPEFIIPAAAGGAAKGIPMLIGTTHQELSFLFVRPVAKALDIMGFIKDFITRENEGSRDEITQTYGRYYKGRRLKTMMFTDFIFRMGNVWFAEECGRYSDVWMYRFDFETAAMKVSRLYTFHSSDLPFVFGNFKTFMAHLMLLFTPSKKRARRVSNEMQNDFAAFARTGSLPWKSCGSRETPAKCYNKKSSVEPMVPPDIIQQYEKTHFRKICFQKSFE